jgi:hypothetical protein
MIINELPSLIAIRLRDPCDFSGLTKYWVFGMISIDAERGLNWSDDLHDKLDYVDDVLYLIEVELC